FRWTWCARASATAGPPPSTAWSTRHRPPGAGAAGRDLAPRLRHRPARAGRAPDWPRRRPGRGPVAAIGIARRDGERPRRPAARPDGPLDARDDRAPAPALGSRLLPGRALRPGLRLRAAAAARSLHADRRGRLVVPAGVAPRAQPAGAELRGRDPPGLPVLGGVPGAREPLVARRGAL